MYVRIINLAVKKYGRHIGDERTRAGKSSISATEWTTGNGSYQAVAVALLAENSSLEAFKTELDKWRRRKKNNTFISFPRKLLDNRGATKGGPGRFGSTAHR